MSDDRAAGAGQWEPCVEHRGNQVGPFVDDLFGQGTRQVLLIAGAGFDPRTTSVAGLLSAKLGTRLRGLFLREERPTANPGLAQRAEANLQVLRADVSKSEVVEVKVFDTDGAVVIGRNAVNAAKAVGIDGVTDVVVDLSALSIGASFPITRYCLDVIRQQHPNVNLHVMVTASSSTDELILPTAGSVAAPVHGFKGRWNTEQTSRAAKLWMPQLRLGHRAALRLLHDIIKPHDVVPILPFPATDARSGDALIDHYSSEFEELWEVDSRSIMYAAEDNPLDFYRSVLRIADGRDSVFRGTGGSLLILSPIGSKVVALGAMLAAMDRDFPVMYVESLGYTADLAALGGAGYSSLDMVHIWLQGEVYAPSLRPLQGGESGTSDI